MTRYLPFLLLIFTTSCLGPGFTQKPLASEKPRNNVTYNVEYLFENDGCKVYRFYDRGFYIYYTNCKGDTITRTDSTEKRNTTIIR